MCKKCSLKLPWNIVDIQYILVESEIRETSFFILVFLKC